MRGSATPCSFRKALRRFAERREGNVAVIVAVVIGVLMFALCMTVDYTLAAARQEQLQGYADAAALSATTPSAMLTSAAAAQSAAQAAWDGQAGALGGVSAESGHVTVTDSNPGAAGNTRTVTITFTAKSNTLFSGVLGVATLPLQGSSSATMGAPPYINIYILVDNSQSMGIADTQADMASLYAITQKKNFDGCVFGCHVPLYFEPYSDETLAHQNNITLRIDSAKSAISTMINLAKTNNLSTRVQFALYTMGAGNSGGSTLIKKISGPSNDYTTLLSQVSNIDLETSALGVYGDTDIEDAMTSLKTALPATNGKGKTQATAVNYVFIVTDGLDDFNQYDSKLPCINDPAPGGWRCTQTPHVSACNSLQAAANIGVVYTPYLPLYNNNDPSAGFYSAYQTLVQQYSASIQTNLQSCASSPQLFFIASDGASITSAMTTLFGRAINAPYLTS